MRNTSFVAAMVLVAGAGGGCQPKDAAGPTSRPTAAYPPSREPMRRVEVVTQQSTKVADTLVGRKCRVQMRRDALGMAGNTPIALSGRWATESSVDGTVLELTDQWLVVQATGKRVVIPHASILVIELQD